MMHDAVKYVIRMEPGVQTPEQTLRTGHRLVPRFGVAARANVAALGLGRAVCLGLFDSIAARRETARWARRVPQPTSPICTPGPKFICPAPAGSGWTRRRDCWPAKAHLPLAATPDPFSAAPITGSVEPCEVEFNFAMSVQRIHEDPRVTKPYTDEQWTQDRGAGA